MARRPASRRSVRTSPSPEADAAAFLEAVRTPEAPASLAVLRDTLRGRDFARIRRTGEVIRDHLIAALAAEAEQTLLRLLDSSFEADPGCEAKLALAEALYRLGEGSPALWRRVITCVQMEPVWGRSIDTAANLRGAGAAALIATGDPQAPFDVVNLLTDPEPQARCGAVQALGELQNTASELLLRFKALTGDPEPAVIATTLDTLARIAPEASVEFIAGFLDAPGEQIREAAAVALASTRRPDAFDRVRAVWNRARSPDARRSLVRGLALFRTDEAFDLVLQTLRSAPPILAIPALRGLRVYATDPDRTEAIRRAVEQRADPRLAREFEELYG